MRSDVLPVRFHRRAARIIDAPWAIAVGADFLHPQTVGPKPPATDLANRYTQRLVRATHTSLPLARTFNRVVNLVEPPVALARPSVVPRSAAASVTGCGGVHPVGPPATLRRCEPAHLNRMRAPARVSLRDGRRGSGELAVAPAARAGGRGCPLARPGEDGTHRAPGRRGPRPWWCTTSAAAAGSMGRWLAPLLAGPQHWVLHDRDPDLLDVAAAEPAPGCGRRGPRHRRDPAGRPHPAGRRSTWRARPSSRHRPCSTC